MPSAALVEMGSFSSFAAWGTNGGEAEQGLECHFAPSRKRPLEGRKISSGLG